MKRFLFFPLLFLVFLCQAQKIRLTDTSNYWLSFHQVDGWPSGQYYFTGFYLSGDTLVGGVNYKKVVENGYFQGFVLREDTALGKVWGISFNANDGEHLIYDYNLAQGDTLWGHKSLDTFAYSVVSVDSVLVNGIPYKRQFLQCIINCGFTPSYYVVEGLGSSMSPIDPFYPRAEFENNLICFSNKGSRPTINPGFIFFNNTTSCLLDLQDIASEKGISIYQNPIHANSKIVFPYRISSAKLTISDFSGRVVFANTFKSQKEIRIGNIPLPSGMYFLTVTDLESGKVFKEKIVVE
jgi:hypothetical protein